MFTNQNVSPVSASSTTVNTNDGMGILFEAITSPVGGQWSEEDILVKRADYDATGNQTINWYNITTGQQTPLTIIPTEGTDADRAGKVLVVEEITMILDTTVESLEDILIRANGGLPTSVPSVTNIVEMSLNAGEIRSTVKAGNNPSYSVLSPSGRRTTELGQVMLISKKEAANARFVSDSTAEVHFIFKNVMNQ